ncbi:hypothetical protein CVS40_4252 [Lucilia cuprina]|nr:hypothetical protein CVS40_4252 [Lucilia cuprina]
MNSFYGRFLRKIKILIQIRTFKINFGDLSTWDKCVWVSSCKITTYILIIEKRFTHLH